MQVLAYTKLTALSSGRGTTQDAPKMSQQPSELYLLIPKVRTNCTNAFIMRVDAKGVDPISQGYAELSSDLRRLTIFTDRLKDLDPGMITIQVSLRIDTA